MKIIAFVGLPGSGKSEASNIAIQMKIPVISMGNVVREEVKKLNLNMSYCSKVADDLRKKKGSDIIAKRCIPEIMNIIESKKNNLIIIDGIRGFDELNYFHSILQQKIITIFIDSNITNRFQRILKRKRNDDMVTIENLIKRDTQELNWGLKKIIENSSIVIENKTTLIEFKRTIFKLLTNIL